MVTALARPGSRSGFSAAKLVQGPQLGVIVPLEAICQCLWTFSVVVMGGGVGVLLASDG